MELETFVLENTKEMDLGEAQKAYNDYPQAGQTFQGRRDQYKVLVAELKSRDPGSITSQEMQRIDALAKEVELIQKECQEMKTILSRKLEQVLLDAKELEGDFAYHARDFDDEEGVEWGRSLVKEALELREGNELLHAVEKAYQARECLAQLVTRAKNVWIEKHQEKADSLVIDQEV